MTPELFGTPGPFKGRPFSGLMARCSKCGWDGECVIRYQPARATHLDGQTTPDGEHLGRVCHQCGYRWAEECVDAA